MTHTLLPGESHRAYADFSDLQTDLPAPRGMGWSHLVTVQEVCPAGACYTPEPLDGLTLFLTVRGRTHLHVGVRTLLHQPGTLMAVASRCTLREQVLPDEPWDVCYLQLQGEWASQMDAWLWRQESPVWSQFPVPLRTRQNFFEMFALGMTQPEGWAWRFLSRSAELLGDLYFDSQAAHNRDSLVLQLARRLDSAPSERFTIDELAAFCRLTPRQLLYQFRKSAGEPLAQWIRKRRIGTARRLLGQGHSVTEVSDQLGFANPYHFSRTFKTLSGVSPSVFRTQALRAALHTNPDQKQDSPPSTAN